MSVHTIYRRVSPHFRRRRIEKFVATFNPGPETRILDVGGYPFFWEGLPVRARVTVLNIHPIENAEVYRDRYELVVGDGTALDYPDASFDIAFSNSVIEHLGDADKQAAFAREVTRVGKGYWVQTPAREFFIEPHYIAPFIHWFPPAAQRRLARYFTLWGWMAKPGPTRIRERVEELRLLRAREFQNLFPDAEDITRERLLGMTKSYVAWKR